METKFYYYDWNRRLCNDPEGNLIFAHSECIDDFCHENRLERYANFSHAGDEEFQEDSTCEVCNKE